LTDVATVAAVLVAVTSIVAGLAGAACWWLVRAERWPVILLRGAQICAGAGALAAGVLAAAGFDPDDDLYWLYAVLPVGIGFFAEQIRIVSAQSVLDARGLESAAAVGELDAAGQRSVVVAILRRELGVLVIAALVSGFLALRALGTL
jgi:hypothetical protein